MAQFLEFLQMGAYFFLIIPSIVVVLGAWLIGAEDQKQLTRKRLLLLLVTATLSLALLGLLIWTNPYGREINSSLPAIGMLPVLVALVVLILRKPREIVQLWSTDKAILAPLVLISLVFLGFLWLAEPTTFYTVAILTVALASIWLIGTRSGLTFLTALSLVSVAYLIFVGGGAFLTPGLEASARLLTTMQILAMVVLLLTIFLPAALLYASFREETELDLRRLSWRLALVAILVAGSAYPVFWDGVWSAAHARAFEDHLPFIQFLLSLMAGVLLALSLRGWRRLVGPAFVVLVITVTTLALVWGWNVSAFDLTEHRAARVDQAVDQFHEDNNRFPTDLAELTPRYLLYLPPPVVVRQGGWCYQGGEDFYRLGYVSGQFTYFSAQFQTKIYAQAGEPPKGSWSCDQLVAKFEAGELNY